MKSLILLFTTKIMSFIGGSINTAGFLTFFVLESLEPYRWEMIFGGFVLMGTSELISHLYIKKIVKDIDSDKDGET